MRHGLRHALQVRIIHPCPWGVASFGGEKQGRHGLRHALQVRIVHPCPWGAAAFKGEGRGATACATRCRRPLFVPAPGATLHLEGKAGRLDLRHVLHVSTTKHIPYPGYSGSDMCAPGC